MPIQPRLGTLVQYQVPQHIREDKEQFLKFIQYYYNWCEQTGQPTEFLNNIILYKDVDHASDFYAELIFGYYSRLFPNFSSVDKRTLVKNIKDFFRAKGTFPSYQFVMQAVFNEEVSMEFNSNKVFRASGNTFRRDCYIAVDVGSETDITDGFADCLGMTFRQDSTRSKGTIERVTSHIHNGRKIQVIKLEDKTVRNNFLPLIPCEAKKRGSQEETVSGIVSTSIVAATVVNKGSLYRPGAPVRVFDGTGVGIDASVTEITSGGIDEVIIINKGRNYVVGDVIEANDRSASGEGFVAVVSSIDGISAKAVIDQSVEDVLVRDGGYGYKIGDILTISQSDLTQDTSVGVIEIEVSSVSNDSALKGLKIARNTSGHGYTKAKLRMFDHTNKTIVPTTTVDMSVTVVKSISRSVLNTSLRAGSLIYPVINTYGFTLEDGLGVILTEDATLTRLTEPYPDLTSLNVSVHVNGFGARAAANVAGGAVTSIDLIQGGYNYISPTISLIGDGQGALLLPEIDANGTITSITITKGGTGYTTAPTLVIKESAFIGPTAGGGCLVTPNVVNGELTTIDIDVINVGGTDYLKGGSGYSDPIVIIKDATGIGAEAECLLDPFTGSITSIDILDTGTGYSGSPEVRIVDREIIDKKAVPSAIIVPLIDDSASSTGQILGTVVSNKGSIVDVTKYNGVKPVGGSGSDAIFDLVLSPASDFPRIVSGGKHYHFDSTETPAPNVTAVASGGIGEGFEVIFGVTSGVITDTFINGYGINYPKHTKILIGDERPLPPIGTPVVSGNKFHHNGRRFNTTTDGVITDATYADMAAFSGSIGNTITPSGSTAQYSFTGMLASASYVINDAGSITRFNIVYGGTGYEDSGTGLFQIPITTIGSGHAQYNVIGDSTGTITAANLIGGGSEYWDQTEVTPLTLTFSAPASGETAEGYPVLDSDGRVSAVIINKAGSGYVTPPTITRSGGNRTQVSLEDNILVADVNIFDGRVVEVVVTPTSPNGLLYGTTCTISGNGTGGKIVPVVNTGISEVSIDNDGDGEFYSEYLANVPVIVTVQDVNRTVAIDTLVQEDGFNLLSEEGSNITLVPSFSIFQEDMSGYVLNEDGTNILWGSDQTDAVLKIVLDDQGSVSEVQILESGTGYVTPIVVVEGAVNTIITAYAFREIKELRIDSKGSGYDIAFLDINGDGFGAEGNLEVDRDGGVIDVNPVEIQFNGSTDVNTTIDRITSTAHPFNFGDAVRYIQSTTAIGGLIHGRVYFVSHVSTDSFCLAPSITALISGAVVDITALGSNNNYTLRSVGYGYAYSPTINITDNSGFGSISGVRIVERGDGYIKLPYLTLPVSPPEDVTPRLGGKVIAYSDSVGSVNHVGFDYFGYGYEEEPILTLPMTALVFDANGFEQGERILVKDYPYVKKELIKYLKDSNPIEISSTAHPDPTVDTKTGVIYLQRGGYQIELEDWVGEPEYLLFDTIGLLTFDDGFSILQENGGRFYVDTAEYLSQDESIPGATTSSLGIKAGMRVIITSSEEPDLDGSWPIIDVTEYAFTIAIPGSAAANNTGFDLDSVRLLMEDTGPSGTVSFIDASTNYISLDDATDLMEIMTEDGAQLVDETGSAEFEHEFSYAIPNSSVIIGSKSGHETIVLRSNRAEVNAVSGAGGFTNYRFENSVGMFDTKESKLHNNERLQDFAYVLKCGLSLDQYETVIKKTVHPAGYKVFGDIVGQLFLSLPKISLPIQDKYGDSAGSELTVAIAGGLGDIDYRVAYKNERFMFARRFDWHSYDMNTYDRFNGFHERTNQSWDFENFEDHQFDFAYESTGEALVGFTKTGDAATIAYSNVRFHPWPTNVQSHSDDFNSEYVFRVGEEVQVSFGVQWLTTEEGESERLLSEAGETLWGDSFDGEYNQYQITDMDDTSFTVALPTNFANVDAGSAIVRLALGENGYLNSHNSRIRLYSAYDGAMSYTLEDRNTEYNESTGAYDKTVGIVTINRTAHGFNVGQLIQIEFLDGAMALEDGYYHVMATPTVNTFEIHRSTTGTTSSGSIISIAVDTLSI